MGRLSAVEREFRETISEFDRQSRARLENGPPEGYGITPEAWATWWNRGYVVCPGRRDRHRCRNADCGFGVTCQRLAAIGLNGAGEPLPIRARPRCGARNRKGELCQVRVEAGKRRCRFHGGLSTGPKTPEGKARIAEAHKRWREAQPALSPVMPPCR